MGNLGAENPAGVIKSGTKIIISGLCPSWVFYTPPAPGAAYGADAVKNEAEAALLAYFKSPIYLIEKEFFDPTDDDGGIDETMIVVPPVAN